MCEANKMIKPNPEQESIINYFTQNNTNKRILLVEAPPGTGKTFTAVATAMNYVRFNINIFKKCKSTNRETVRYIKF